MLRFGVFRCCWLLVVMLGVGLLQLTGLLCCFGWWWFTSCLWMLVVCVVCLCCVDCLTGLLLVNSVVVYLVYVACVGVWFIV